MMNKRQSIALVLISLSGLLCGVNSRSQLRALRKGGGYYAAAAKTMFGQLGRQDRNLRLIEASYGRVKFAKLD